MSHSKIAVSAGYYYKDGNNPAMIVYRNDVGVIVSCHTYNAADLHVFHKRVAEMARGETLVKSVHAEKPSPLGKHVQFSLVDDMKLTHLVYHNDFGIPEQAYTFDLTRQRDRELFATEMRAIIYEQVTMK